MLNRRQILTSLAALPLMTLASPGHAAMPMIFSSGGLAINGFDPVGYFSDSRPILGRRDQALLWKGAIWSFASRANRIEFESNPWAFAPRFGGYCAYSVSIGQVSTTEPDAWFIHDDQLYLTHDLPTRKRWLRDVTGNIERANKNWPAVLRQ